MKINVMRKIIAILLSLLCAANNFNFGLEHTPAKEKSAVEDNSKKGLRFGLFPLVDKI